MGSTTDYVRAVLWIDQQQPLDHAELVVRLAVPSRWPAARIGPSDVMRAARAISLDPRYYEQVYDSALRTVQASGVPNSLRALLVAGAGVEARHKRDAFVVFLPSSPPPEGDGA